MIVRNITIFTDSFFMAMESALEFTDCVVNLIVRSCVVNGGSWRELRFGQFKFRYTTEKFCYTSIL